MRGVSALVCVAAILVASPVRADKRSDAKALFEEGQRKFDVGKFDDAAANWVKAYELVGNSILLYNIAQAYRLGNQYEKALSFYKAYLRRDEKSPVRKEVEARMAEMTHLMEQSRKTNESPPQGTLNEPKSEPGTAEPSTKPGTEPGTTAEPGTTEPNKANKSEPQQNPAANPPPANPPPGNATAPAPGANYRYAGYGLLGLTVASIAIGGAMTGLSQAAASDVEHAAKTGGTFDSSLQAKASNGPTYDAVAATFYAVAGASAVAAGVLLYMGFRKPAATRASLTPMVSSTSAGLLVGGRF
jgi:tetratricopeptide (TPR) repeat protein